MPDPAAACLALGDLYAHRWSGSSGCGGPPFLLYDPASARISGTVNHRRYTLDLQSEDSWCGHTPRSLLRDYWILSTFPCTVTVAHEPEPGAPAAYPAWAHWAGCRSLPDAGGRAPPPV